MKFNLKQGSGAVAGELLVDVVVRTRTAILSFTRNNSRVDGSLCRTEVYSARLVLYSACANGSSLGAIVCFSDHGLIHDLLYWIPRRI